MVWLESVIVAARGAPSPPLFPYTTLFRSRRPRGGARTAHRGGPPERGSRGALAPLRVRAALARHRHLGRAPLGRVAAQRSEEHTSELQSRLHLVCRLPLEKKSNSNSPTAR